MVFYLRLTCLPQEERGALLRRVDEISDSIWLLEPHYWAKLEESLFARDAGCVLIRHADVMVGYSFYQRLHVDGARVVHRITTSLLPEHQGKGLYTAITGRIIATEQQAAGDEPLYVTLRTSNPISWAANAKWCTVMMPHPDPSKTDMALCELGRQVAQILFPRDPLEIPSMVLRGTYASIAYREPQHHATPEIDRMFFQNPTLSSQDAFFAIGKVRRFASV